jgi:hypothetical protein
MLLRRFVTLSAAFALLVAAPASALVKLPATLSSVAGNPAEKLVNLPIEQSKYDAATRCTPKARPGMTAFTRWLQSNASGVSWGTYRCEKWGKRSASLHAEGRAIDWHLDVSKPADRAEAKRLILLLLAPDSAGNEQALARRMGIEEIIWDCGYWGAGMTDFDRYSPCYSKNGRLRRKVNATVAHRDHIHFGMTRAGAARKTSFWTRKAPPASEVAPPADDFDEEWPVDGESPVDDEPEWTDEEIVDDPSVVADDPDVSDEGF